MIASRPRSAPPRIAVIDDDAIFLELMQELLGSQGYDVFTCSRWVDSFDAIKDVQPDLVLLDVMLGREQSGWVILELLRTDPATSAIPVLMCTAAAPVLDARPHVPGVEFVAKPFDIDHLERTVERLLSTARAPLATN